MTTEASIFPGKLPVVDAPPHSGDRYKRIVDEAREIIYRITPTGHFTFVNPMAAAVLRRRIDECVGCHFLSLIREDYRERALKFYTLQIRQKEPTTYFEFPAIAGDGAEIWIGQNVELVIDRGEIVELQGVGRDITAQKQMEDELVESERRYRNLFEASPHPMWVFDAQTLKFLAVSNAAVDSYGYSAEEFLRMTVREIRPPEEIPRLEKELSHPFTSTVYGTWKHVKKSGEVIDVEITALSLVFDGRDAYLVTATDVTARLRAEAERQVMLDVIQSVNVTSNLDELLKFIHQSLATIVYAENCFVALHDETTNSIHFEYWVDQRDDVLPPMPLGDGFTSFVLRNGKPLSLTGELKARMYSSGEVKKVGSSSASWLGVPLRTPTRTIGVLVVQDYEKENRYSQLDIDFMSSVGGQIALAIERKRGEQLLQEANARAIIDYERLLERVTKLAEGLSTARDVLPICHAVSSFAFSATPASRVFVTQYEPATVLASPIYGRVDSVEIADSKLTSLLDGNLSHMRALRNGELVLNNSCRTSLPENSNAIDLVETAGSVLITPLFVNGKVVGAIEIQSSDSGVFQKTHVTAMQMAAGLAGTAVANARLLQLERQKEEQLQQAQKMEAVGQVAGGVAHDFNNLLTAITGYADMCLRKLEPGTSVRRNVEEIGKAAQRAASLTRQLLAFSRKQVLQPRVLDLNHVVADMEKMLRRLIGENVELVTKLDKGLGYVKADPGQVERVVMNLVVNARDASADHGRVTIQTSNIERHQLSHLELSSVDSCDKYVMLAVSDNGSGMDAATQKRIFDPFFTTKEQGKGTGLGLSTVYGVIEQSGGKIEVESKLGVGSTFRVYLPRVDDPKDNPCEKRMKAPPIGTETILLVEDEEIVRNMTRHILQLSQYTVIEASDGCEAIEICKKHEGELHLLLSDIVMPHMNGPILAQRIKELRADVKILFMSGYADVTSVEQVINSQIPFLQKPFSPDLLAARVREVLDGKADTVN